MIFFKKKIQSDDFEESKRVRRAAIFFKETPNNNKH